ncbi:MAG: AAA family ATPase [Legionella sp.]|nr:AAA family ATPase [Legionella sp.]
MAIYHYHRGIGKRADGKNAVFAAAYIRGEKKTCDRTQETKDFSNKEEVIYKNTFIPEGAPTWAMDLRDSFVIDSEGKKHSDVSGELFSTYAWNQLEFSEKRVDSQLYFHDDIALPNALNQEQAIELVCDFVKNHLAIEGVFCDVAIHWDDNNHHFHVLMPLRTLTDFGFSQKIRRTKSELAQEVKRVREAWANVANQKLQTLGIDERIDHRSNKERGLELIPTIKIGKFSRFPDQTISIRKVHENELIRKANSAAIQENPSILADKILQERPFFDSNIVADEINRHVLLEQIDCQDRPISKKADPVFESLFQSIQQKEGIINERTLKQSVLERVDSAAEFARIYNKITSHEDVFSLGLGEDGRQHFVGRHAFDMENRLLKTTHHLALTSTFSVSKRLVKQVGLKFKLNPAQQRALLHLTRSGNAALVCGYAGTGKTYMLKAAKEIWEQSGFKVLGLATAGKAASGLEAETGIASKTIYSFLEAVKKHQITIDEKTIIVMDEMGMTSLDDMSAVMEIVRAHGAKFAGVGDVEQTQPVGRGAPQRAMIDAIGAVFLDTIIRQESDWQRKATLLLETNQTAAGFDLYAAHSCVHLHESEKIAYEATVGQWYAHYEAEPDANLKDFIITAFKNETVTKLNLMARETLLSHGKLHRGVLLNANMEVSVGERLLFTRNDNKIGVRNGDFATVVSITKDAKRLEVQLDNGVRVAFSPEQYKYFVYGYAATVHKLQGHTTRDCNVLVDGEGWDRHKFLVAATRHKANLNIHAACDSFVDLAHLKSSVSRHGLNDILTDFPVAFAQRRGFTLETSASIAAQIIQKSKAKIFDAVGYLFNHQGMIEQGQSAYDLSVLEIEHRRKNAVIVAEFSDNRAQMASLLNQMKCLEGEDAKAIQDAVYALQLRNGQIASLLKANPELYTIALERNRLGASKVESAFEFHERHQFVASLFQAHEALESLPTDSAYQLVHQIKTYYGAICHQVPDKETRNAFLQALEQRADIYRRDSAIEVFGIEHRALVNMAARYKALDKEVGARLKGLQRASVVDKKELYLASIKRDQLSYELISSPLSEAINLHFAINLERLAKHAQRSKDRLFVKAFSGMPTSTQIQGNLMKQAAAHRIKMEPKRYGIYIDEFLKEGWKRVNLENWSYERRKTIASASNELKRSILQVRRYKMAASNAYQQWQKAIERSKKNSPHKNKGFKQAQGLSWKRSLLAHEIMGALNQHVAALSIEKVDTTKLYQQALQVDYLNRYRTETRATLKMHMARHIFANLKDFQAGLAVHGLYNEVKEYATHYQYLQRIKDAPGQEMKTVIRLALTYQDKKMEAGIVWGQVKTLEKLKADKRGLLLQAKQILMQRNEAAHALLQSCTQKAWLTKDFTGIALNLNQLQRESAQFLAQNTINNYLTAKPGTRGALAGQLLANKVGYHLLFDNCIGFDTLKKEVKQFERLEQLKSESHKLGAQTKESAPLWDVARINTALMDNPVDTYVAILGEPKEYHTNHLRYSGGLIVSTKGNDAGKWYCFTEEVGGTPIAAIQKYLNLSFPQALDYGASLAGLRKQDAQITRCEMRPTSVMPDRINLAKINQGQISAQSIWDGAIDAQNTLASRYFTQHRKITSIKGMEIRYWPKGAVWVDIDENNKPIEKPNKIPAAVIAGRNAQGELVCVQRIYLDAATAGKNTFLKNAKLNKGSNKGAAGVIQKGVAGGLLYLAEGPETAASLASMDKDATVLVTFGVGNISALGDVIKSHSPGKVILAADNDGADSPTRKTTQEATQMLREQGIDVRIIYPDMLANKDKTDWNDILVEQGIEALHASVAKQRAKTQWMYEQSPSIDGTLGANYFASAPDVNTTDIRFVKEIDYKGYKVCALVVPRHNAQGIICGETLFALSEDGKTILAESNKNHKHTSEGFYTIQKGDGERLIIADKTTLLDAKIMANRYPKASVMLSNLETYQQLQIQLSAEGLIPKKILILGHDFNPDIQLQIAQKGKAFHANGATITLFNVSTREQKKIDPTKLERTQLKKSFEKLISKKIAAIPLEKSLTQARFDVLKKEYPLLQAYEIQVKELKNTHKGIRHERLEKSLLDMAKEIAKDKTLMTVLKRDALKVLNNINERIARAYKQGRGIGR